MTQQELKNDTTDTTTDNQQVVPSATGVDAMQTDNNKTVYVGQSGNEYQFTEEDTKLYGTYHMDNDIARAWSRGRRSGYHPGKPVSEIEDTQSGNKVQYFQYCSALLHVNNDRNPNHNVYFYSVDPDYKFMESGL